MANNISCRKALQDYKQIEQYVETYSLLKTCLTYYKKLKKYCSLFVVSAKLYFIQVGNP